MVLGKKFFPRLINYYDIFVRLVDWSLVHQNFFRLPYPYRYTVANLTFISKNHMSRKSVQILRFWYSFNAEFRAEQLFLRPLFVEINKKLKKCYFSVFRSTFLTFLKIFVRVCTLGYVEKIDETVAHRMI